jgi:hypothetical protein
MSDGKNYQEYLDATELEKCIPDIAGKYRRTSDPTINYNCLAWAVGVQWAWFDPEKGCVGYFWPHGIERELSIPAIRKVLAHFGFNKESNNAEWEEGFLKVAVFIDADGVPSHYARQLENGKWTSKFGELIDVEHDDLECIKCVEYGEPRFYFMREVPKAT